MAGARTHLRAASGLLVVLLALSGCGATQSGTPHPARPDLESIFEAEQQLHADPASAITQMRHLGATRVRVYVEWSALAPAPTSRSEPPGFDGGNPAAYPATTWTLYDQIVRIAAQQHVGLDFTLAGPPPLWAAGPGAPPGGTYPAWRPRAALYRAFVHAVAQRYSGSYVPPGSTAPLPRVDFWAIWNEPNYGPQLAPQATNHSTVEVSPKLYRKLADAAWSALQATGHGRDTILIGEVAPRGLTTGDSPGNFSGMVPLRFIRALYCVGPDLKPLAGSAATLRGCPADTTGSRRFAQQHPVLFRASGFADHPYPQGLPPNVATPDEPDYADFATLPRLEQTLDRVQQVYDSSTRFPIYNTEYGYQTDPPEKIARSTDPVTAAAYLNWSEYLTWRDPRLRSYDQYQLTDPPNASALGGFATGLQFKDGTPKATYDAFRMPLFLPVTSASRGSRLEVWGCVRPTPYAVLRTGKPQQVQIQFQPSGSARFQTQRLLTITDPHGYFDLDLPFNSSGLVRLTWAYPTGEKIHSRVVGVTVH